MGFWPAKCRVECEQRRFYLTTGLLIDAHILTQYMGFVLLDKYSPRLCANACSARTADVDGGRCKFFNIWTAVFNGTVEGPTTCAFVRISLTQSALHLASCHVVLEQHSCLGIRSHQLWQSPLAHNQGLAGLHPQVSPHLLRYPERVSMHTSRRNLLGNRVEWLDRRV